MSFSDLFAFQKAPTPFLLDLQKKQGDLVLRKMGFKRFAFVFHPDLAQVVLRDHAESFRKAPYLFQQMEPIIGKSALVRLEGERWAKYRKLTNQYFAAPKQERFLEAIRTSTHQRFADLQAEIATGAPVDLEPVLAELVLVAAGKMLFGSDLSPFAQKLVFHFLALNKLCGEGIRSVFNLPHAVPTRRHLAQKYHYQKLRETLAAAVRQSPPSSDAEHSIVQHFLQSRGGRAVSAEKRLEQMLAFLYPAFETTSTSLCWATLLLVAHPEWQELCYQAIQASQVSEVPDPRLAVASGPLARVYLESLRLYPPAWILARESLAEVTLWDCKIAKGTTVVVSLNAVHRHPDFWSAPLSFDPNRFSPEARAGAHPFQYIPFGAGPRICSGASLGMTEALVILRELLCRFKLLPGKGLDLSAEERITQRPVNGVPLRFVSRGARPVSPAQTGRGADRLPYFDPPPQVL